MDCHLLGVESGCLSPTRVFMGHTDKVMCVLCLCVCVVLVCVCGGVCVCVCDCVCVCVSVCSVYVCVTQ